MPLPCSICGHPDRAEIDAMIVSGATNRAVARHEWNGAPVSKDAVLRHKAHISSGLARVRAEREEAGPRSAVERLEELYDVALQVMHELLQEGKTTQVLAAIGRLESVIEKIAKLTGELDERTQVNVINLGTNPDFVAMLSTLMDALHPYPEVRAVVAQRLELGGRS